MTTETGAEIYWPGEGPVEYVRADVARRISDQLVEAHQRIDELLRERAELRAELLRLRALVEGE